MSLIPRNPWWWGNLLGYWTVAVGVTFAGVWFLQTFTSPETAQIILAAIAGLKIADGLGLDPTEQEWDE